MNSFIIIFFSEYKWNDEVKENEMGRTYSTKVKRGMYVGYWRENQKKRDHCENQDVGGWIILKWILER
jgi:hypothetical protein